jgi:hypothetical protein
VSQKTPSTRTADAAPDQLPGPLSGAGTTTVDSSYVGRVIDSTLTGAA